MNTYNYNDEGFRKTALYQNFILANPKEGYLKIRAYTAREALPISNLKITVSKTIDNNLIIFYEGVTNSSGIIEKINLPAPPLTANNLDKPSSISYDIKAEYQANENIYRINIYENIYVIQTINLVPTLNVNRGGN